MLVFYDHFEQQINAVELERKGVALRLDRKHRRREDILASVEEILDNNKFKQNITAMSQSISRYDFQKLAVEYISQGFENFKKQQL
jgi:UDP:flavonoid glycosyltransferase YjiC (YdhE family)